MAQKYITNPELLKRDFTDKFITSIAGGIKGKDKMIKSLSGLINDEEVAVRLVFLVDVIGFNPKNISSILHGSGAKAAESIKALCTHKDNLKELVSNGFNPKNISSILSGSGAKAAESIKALCTHKDNLKQLVSDGFTAANISSILNRSGAKAAESIKALCTHKDNLKELVSNGFPADNLYLLFHKKSSNQLSKKVARFKRLNPHATMAELIDSLGFLNSSENDLSVDSFDCSGLNILCDAIESLQGANRDINPRIEKQSEQQHVMKRSNHCDGGSSSDLSNKRVKRNHMLNEHQTPLTSIVANKDLVLRFNLRGFQDSAQTL